MNTGHTTDRTTDRTTDTTTGRAGRPEIPTRLLVHALVREDGTVDAGELYTVAGILGMTDQQVRLCVKRLTAEGRFTHEGRGRKAVLRAVADVSGSLAPDAAYVRHAYRQDHGLAPWDGTWHLFAFAIPESSRGARDALRDTLLHLGAAPVQGGLYVSANPIADLVEAQARHLGVSDSLTRLTSGDLRVGDLVDPPAVAAALWPLEEIAERHRRLAAFAETCLTHLSGGTPLSAAEQLTMAVGLAAEFTRAMGPDPLLPPELLPAPWPGSRARRLTAACWNALLTSRTQEDPRQPLPRLFRLYEDALRPCGAQVDPQ
ncbi:PaaX family transcriptional regulator C-terminal domain-containing protein [Streptomyces sp. NPDC046261]|uniref:PaaX family transcriptional regulator C-terminal domain-containing protein n=1 Tax=Streptomyces sp. NPDC046261 TaxID=3157200 RepID=UPI003411B409